jgi:hypothetical protein
MVVLVECKLGVLHSLAEVTRRIVVGEKRRILRVVVMVLHSLVVGIVVAGGHRKAAVGGIAVEEPCSLPAEEVVRHSLPVVEVELRTAVEEECIRLVVGIVVMGHRMVHAEEGSLLEPEDIADSLAEGNDLGAERRMEGSHLEGAVGMP